MPDTIRRRILKSLSAFPFLFATRGLAATPTPAQGEGPFYPEPKMRWQDQDNDLVRIASKVRDAGGEIIRLTGNVLDRGGVPIAGARVEIWQVDMNARYLHTADPAPRPRDEMFQGFGHATTDADGRYEFRTIKPVTYPGRTPHIHVKVFVNDAPRLTSQFYIAGHRENANDQFWRALSDDERAALEMNFVVRENGIEEANVDIVV